MKERELHGARDAMDQSPAPLSDSLRDHYGVDGSRFAVLLIGMDGGVKLRSEEPVTMTELFSLIDSMPMRRREMRESEKQ